MRSTQIGRVFVLSALAALCATLTAAPIHAQESDPPALPAALDPAKQPLDTQLFWAACQGDLPRVRELLDQGANPNVRCPDPAHEGKTVGGLAALAGIGKGAILRELIARGADVNQDGGKGFTPLHAAAVGQDEGIVTLLLAKGARVARGSSGDTPLHAAALLGTPKTVKLLLDAGAKVNVQNGERNTPLMNAARMGSPETVRLLLARGADPKRRNDRGDTAADAARLAEFCRGFPHNINLIPYNAHPLAAFSAPREEAVDAFARALLAERPQLVTVRRSRGRDVHAACGQLVQS